jgi:hypothetical protein
VELLLTTLLPSLLPAVADGARGLFARLFKGKGAQPQNVTEVIALMNADTEKLKTLAALDAPSGDSYKWVNAVRSLQRPVVSGAVIIGYLLACYGVGDPSQGTVDTLAQYASMVTFYLFGDRTYSYIKGNAK